MISIKNIFSIFVLLFIISCAPTIEQSFLTPYKRNIDILRERIDYLLSDPNLSNAQIGIVIESLNNDEVIIKKNEFKLFIPASNMKLFTTAAALLNFGPKFEFKTDVFIKDSIIADKLYGDLLIRGRGDPTISANCADGDANNTLLNWADNLKFKNIKIIHGDIVGDESYFQNNRLGFGWQWDDEPYSYSAQLSALSFNNNCIDVLIKPSDAIGTKPETELLPSTNYVSINNLAATCKTDCVTTLTLTRLRSTNTIIIENEIPVNKPLLKKTISVENPALYFTTVFSEILKKEGIEILGKVRTVSDTGLIDYSNYKKLLTHKSPTLEEIIKTVNKSSQNLYAEQLLLTLGAEYGNMGTSREGVKVVCLSTTKMGISDDEFLMYDGSGLSRNNLVTPDAIIKLLRYMEQSTYFSYFYNSLSIAGIDGTLEHRMENSVTKGKIYAKTGGMSHIKVLSGYATSKDDERFVFSLLINNYNVPSSAIEILQDKICVLLSNFKRDN